MFLLSMPMEIRIYLMKLSLEMSAIPQFNTRGLPQKSSYRFSCYLMGQEHQSTGKTSVDAAQTSFIVDSSADLIQTVEFRESVFSVNQFTNVAE